MILELKPQDLLLSAAADIEDFGWVPRGADDDSVSPYGTYARCPWIALLRVVERTRELYPSVNVSDALFEAEDAICKVADVRDIGEFFDLNDSQPLSEGKEWAVSILKKAATIATAQDLETKATDTDSIESPVTGSTINVVNRVKQWFKELRQGK